MEIILWSSLSDWLNAFTKGL